MNGNGTNKKGGRKIGTRLELGSPDVLAMKPPQNLVPKEISTGLGFIRYKKNAGRIYYQHVKTVWTSEGPRQKVIQHLGTQLPPGVRLGPVDEKTARKLKGVK